MQTQTLILVALLPLVFGSTCLILVVTAGVVARLVKGDF